MPATACGRAGEPLDVVAACSDAFDVDGYRRLEEIGVTHLLTKPWLLHGLDGRSAESKCDGVRRFADAVIARMR